VRHFDTLRDADVRQARVLNKQIEHLYRSGQLSGGLAGKNQQADERS